MNGPIALMRAREDAARSAALLRARGFAVALAPATQIRASGALPPLGRFDAVAATSAKAVALLAPAARAAIAALPLYVVGEQTARAASEAGLALAHAAAPDVAGLCAVLRDRLPPHSRVLYLAGRDRKSALEDALRDAGHRAAALEVYAAEPRAAWDGEEARAVAACRAALHYSRRSAQLALDLAGAAGIAGAFGAMAHVCLSWEVAEPLRAAGLARIVCADAPAEERLLAALERLRDA